VVVVVDEDVDKCGGGAVTEVVVIFSILAGLS
jgi:hypothetical protein